MSAPGDGAPPRRFGAVLCGGASRRMGRDKALLVRPGASGGDEPMLAHAIGTLRSLTADVVLASGDGRRYARFGLPQVADRLADAGPLAGLEAALDHVHLAWDAAPRDVVCVLACDMPRVEPDVFEALLAALGDADGCVLGGAAGREPLLAVYRAGVRGAVRRALDAGRRRVDAFYGDVSVRVLDGAKFEPRAVAFNVNTPEEYRLDPETPRRGADGQAS